MHFIYAFFIICLLKIYILSYYRYCVPERTIISGSTAILFLSVSRKTDGIHLRHFCNPNFGCDTANASTLKFSAKNSPSLSLFVSLVL